MVACLLMPLGLERIALVPMGWGIDAISAIARAVTQWPGAAFNVPAMPVSGLVVLSFGGFWLCVWRRRWRLWGLVPIAVGFCSILLARPPDLLVDGEARALAARGTNGSYFIAGLSHNSRFVTDTWVRRGASGASAQWPDRGSTADETIVCANDGCRYRTAGRVILLQLDQAGRPDCAGVELTLITVPGAHGCPGMLNLDRTTIRGEGGYAIWLSPAAIEIVSARDWRGSRPWVPSSAQPPPRTVSTSARARPAAPAP
jgi:competence protein ComEC